MDVECPLVAQERITCSLKRQFCRRFVLLPHGNTHDVRACALCKTGWLVVRVNLQNGGRFWDCSRHSDEGRPVPFHRAPRANHANTRLGVAILARYISSENEDSVSTI